MRDLKVEETLLTNFLLCCESRISYHLRIGCRENPFSIKITWNTMFKSIKRMRKIPKFVNIGVDGFVLKVPIEYVAVRKQNVIVENVFSET